MPNVTSQALGLAPGTPLLISDSAEPTTIRVLHYSAEAVLEEEGVSVQRAASLRGPGTVTWVDVVGLAGVDQIVALCEVFGVHPLTLEDILDSTTRPKLDDYGGTLFVVLGMVDMPAVDADHPGGGEMTREGVSLVVGDHFVLTFQERPGDVFGPVRERIRSGRGRVREESAGFLSYALVDAIVDALLEVIEGVGSRVEAMQDEVLHGSDQETPEEIFGLKSDLLFLRKALAPQRDALAALLRSDARVLDPITRTYLRDAVDHIEQVVDLVAMYSDMTSSVMDLHLSMMSHRMNQVMHVLTVLTAVFVPLSFLTGLYGMNFDHMPELHHPLGYPALWLLMLSISGGMMLFFRRKKWL